MGIDAFEIHRRTFERYMARAGALAEQAEHWANMAETAQSLEDKLHAVAECAKAAGAHRELTMAMTALHELWRSLEHDDV